jgi:hypothetical protein
MRRILHNLTLIGDFYGTFDGKGHLIRNLNIDATGKSNVALFGGLYYGEIKNLGREGGSTTGIDAFNVAGLVYSLRNNGKLSNCYNSSSIDVAQGAGGLVGGFYDGTTTTIRNCYNTGDISSSGMHNGGLIITSLYGAGTVYVINSYNAGNVSGINYTGGLTGNVTVSLGTKHFFNLNNFFNFGNITHKTNSNNIGSFIGSFFDTSVEVNATNVYSRPNVVSIDNGLTPKPNQPIGLGSPSLNNTILNANPTMGENEKYSLEYSKTPAFAAELGDAFKHAPGRTPKLAWEK